MIEAHKIGVSLVMSSNHADILRALTADIGRTSKVVDELGKHLGGIGPIITTAFAAITGGAIIAGFKALIDQTKELSHELTQIQKLGVGASETADVRRRAADIASRVPGLTSMQPLEAYGQVYSMTGGNTREAQAIMEPLSKWALAMGNTKGSFDVGGDDMRKVTRAAEQLGRLTTNGEYDPKKFQAFLDMTSRAAAITHGAVDASTWMNMATTGGPAMAGMSDRGLLEAAVAAQTMGGYRVGTAEMSTYQQFVGGQMTRRTAQALADLGIISQGDLQVGGAGGAGGRGRGGRGRHGNLGGSEGGQMNMLSESGREKLRGFLGDSPMMGIEHLVQAMEQHGITDPQKQQEQLFRVLGRQTTQRLWSDFMRNRGQVQKEVELIEGGPGVDQQLGLANQGDVAQNLHNLSAAWKELLFTISDDKGTIQILHQLTGAINSLKEALGAVIGAFNSAEKKVQEWGKLLHGGSGKDSPPGAESLIPYSALPMSYTPGGGSSNPVMMTLTGPVAIAINGQLMGQSGGGFSDGFGGGGGGGGITNASFTTGGGNPLGGASSAGGFRAITGGGMGGAAARALGGGGGLRGPSSPDAAPTSISAALASGGGGGFAGSKRDSIQAVYNAWHAAGMSDAGIAGLLANIGEESSFNPNLRHADQPAYSGEAHFAHGLYQEGGAEWNHFASWLNQNHPGSDWRDPKLQSEFAAENLKKNYPSVWNAMNGGNVQQAAGAYASGYLKPAARYLRSRLAKFSRGLPGLDHYMGAGGGGLGRWSTGDIASALGGGGGAAAAGAWGAPKIGPGANLQGVDPVLVQAMHIASAALPEGYTLHPTSGTRGRGQGYHSVGLASDWQIHDPQGRPLPNSGWDKTATDLHGRVARAAYGWLLQNDPARAKRFAWGGAFGTQLGGGGVPDLMHYDFGGQRGHWSDRQPQRMGPLYPTQEETPHVGGLRAFLGKRMWHGKKSIPDHDDTQPSHHTSLHIDGRKVTEAVHKHTNRSMNAASMGSRMPDYSAARPMPV